MKVRARFAAKQALGLGVVRDQPFANAGDRAAGRGADVRSRGRSLRRAVRKAGPSLVTSIALVRPALGVAGDGVNEEGGAQGRDRTTDTVIFSHVLYQLSYLGVA